jgi:hypothetical protein
MSNDTWAAGPGSSPGGSLPPPPVDSGWPPVATPPAAERQRSKGLKFLTGAMIVFGGLTTIGSLGAFTKDDPAYSTGAVVVILALAVGTLVGGIRLSRRGWQPGHEAMNVLAVLPAAVLAVLVVVGAVEKATEKHAPTDAYGYTAFEQEQFVSGCGGGAVCTCLFEEIEKNLSHDEFLAEAQRYAETGTFSPEMTSTITEIYQSSGCFAT